MIKTRIFLGIIAIVAIVGFGFMGCNEDNDTGKTDPCAKGHTPGAAATCEKAQTCTVCSYVIKAAAGHNFGGDSDWAENAEAATCTDPSYDTRDCKNAPCTVKEKRAGSHNALGHNLPGAKAATCIAAGSTGTGHCDRCNQNFTGEAIPINSEAHDFSGEPVITPAACETAGKEVITCGNAGCNVKHETPIDALEHDWDWTENKIAATCVQVSKDTATCKNTPCTKTNERNGSNSALGHTTPQSKPATCTSTGLTGTGHCDRCKEDLTGGVIPIDPDNHDYGEWRLKTAATCVSPEIHTRICSYNNAHTEEQDHGEINPTAHDWNWTLNAIAATCVQVSKDTANCNNTPCTAVDEREGSIPVNPTAHNWGDDAVTEPTCTNYGYTTQKCAFCCDAPTREITIAMWDSAGDGWNGSGALRINVNGVDTANNVKVQTIAANNNPGGQRGTNEYTFTVEHGDIVRIYWGAGILQYENAFAVYYSNAPPSPSFNPASDQWSPSNDPEGKVLVYRQYSTMSSISGGTLLGTVTVIGGVTRWINIVDPLGHDWGDDTVTEPTCTDYGYTTQKCAFGCATREITIAMWDSYGNGWDGSGALRINVNGVDTANSVKVQTTAANNNPSGQRGTNEYKFTVEHGDIVQIYWIAGTYQYENAFAVYYSDAPPRPFFNPASNQWSPSNDPEGKVLVYRQYNTMNSISGGTLLGTVTVIGTSIRCINIVDALGHNLSTTTATCTTAGTGTCTRCNEVVVINALGHDWNWAAYTGASGVRICQRDNSCSATAGIGDRGPAGGTIFYVASSGFTVRGYSGGTGSFAQYTAYYMEAAPYNQATNVTWSSTNLNVTGAVGTAIGTGKANTAAIIAAHSGDYSYNNAAKVVAIYAGGGKNDWFLPSKDELNEMYKAKGQTGIPTTGWLWSSSQSSSNSAWHQHFGDWGWGQSATFKYSNDDNSGVRAVRAF